MEFRKYSQAGNEPVLQNYEHSRRAFLKGEASARESVNYHPISNAHGFFLNQQNILTTQYAGIDKLFHTLIMGMVDDPDYALQKDPRVYERMLRDPQIYYCLQVRKVATTSLQWSISPPAGAEKDATALALADACEKRIKQIPRFSELLDNVMDALLPGLSVNELIWKVDDHGNYIVKQHEPKNKDRFKFDGDGRLYLLSPRAPVVGTLTPNYKFIRHTFNISDGSWHAPQNAGYVYWGRGLADSPLYHYFYFKVSALRFYLRALERYGNPQKFFYTGKQSATWADKMHEVMLALKNDSVVGIPGTKGEVDVAVESSKATQGKGNAFLVLIEYIDTLITRSILGQELMTEMPGHGSYAAAAVHASVFAKFIESDQKLLEDTLNQTLMTFDAQLNTPNVKDELRPIFRFKKAALSDAQPFLALVQQAVSLGLEVSEQQVRELTGLKKPLEAEDILTPPTFEAESDPDTAPENANAGPVPNAGRKKHEMSGVRSKGNGSAVRKTQGKNVQSLRSGSRTTGKPRTGKRTNAGRRTSDKRETAK